MNKSSIVLLAVLFLASFAVALALLSQQHTLPTTGEIAEISATLAEDGTEVISLNWGVTIVGVPYVYDPIAITNTGNLPVTLTLTYDLDSFINVTGVTLTWDYDGHVLYPTDVTTVVIEQTIASDAPPGSGYIYDTWITAVEYEEP